jgi:hypothetical protein
MNIYKITYTGQDFNFINRKHFVAAANKHEALKLFARLYLPEHITVLKDSSAENKEGKRVLLAGGESIYHIRGNFHAELHRFGRDAQQP